MFDLQGHRGARGLWPENTLAGFAGAMELGVSALELDCGVTRDGVVVVSHDPLLTLAPEPFVQALRLDVHHTGTAALVVVLAFDWRVLSAVRRLMPQVAIAALTDQQPGEDTVRIGSPAASPWLGGLDPEHFDGSIVRLVKATGAGSWGPDFLDLDAQRVDQAHALGLRVVPW